MAVGKGRVAAATVVVLVALLLAAEQQPASAYIWPWDPIPWPISFKRMTWPPFKWPPHFPKPCFLDCWEQVVHERHLHSHAVNFFVIADYCTDFCSDWSVSNWGRWPGRNHPKPLPYENPMAGQALPKKDARPS